MLMLHIEKEINEQPDAIQRVFSQPNIYQSIVAKIRAFDPAYVMIAARGSSDNAARYAKYILGLKLGLPVALATPSLNTLYDVQMKVSRALVIGISQSGESEDILAVVEDARAQGALTLSLTNRSTSPLAALTQHHIPLLAGEERSVAATKTYTTQLTALATLVAHWTGEHDLLAEIEQLPDWVRLTLSNTADMQRWIDRYRYMHRFAVIGRGVNYATAYEISLKVKELCYLSGEEYSEADFLHGPIAMIEEGFPIIVIMPDGKTYANMLALLEILAQRKAECLVITNRRPDETLWQNVMDIPLMPEWLTPIAAVIPGQQFARYLAWVRGHNVDEPRGLKKVTVTR